MEKALHSNPQFRCHFYITCTSVLVTLALYCFVALENTLQAQQVASSEVIAKGRLHLRSYISHLEQLQSGEVLLTVTEGMEEGGSEPAIIRGKYSFDIVTGNQMLNQLSRKPDSTFFLRGDNAFYAIDNDSPDADVLIYARDELISRPGFYMPFDVRMLATMLPGRMQIENTSSIIDAKLGDFERQEVVGVDLEGGLVCVTIQPPAMTPEEIIESFPPGFRASLKARVDLGKPLPVKRSRTKLWFDSGNPGILHRCEGASSSFGIEDWQPTFKSSSRWEKKNGFWIISSVHIESLHDASQSYEIELDWDSVNGQPDHPSFDIHNIKDLEGRILVDTRFPEPTIVGVVGNKPDEPPISSFVSMRVLLVIGNVFAFTVLALWAITKRSYYS